MEEKEYKECKEDIVKRLKDLLIKTRAGGDIEDMVLSADQEIVTIRFRNGSVKNVCVAADSGLGIIRDVTGALQ